VIDVGGGASRLVDRLLAEGVGRVAVLDLSEVALDIDRERLGDAADRVEWIAASVTELHDVGSFDVWHDRAVFHFLTDDADRRRYVELLDHTVSPEGFAVMATFAPDGPERCSGLEVRRYDAQQLASELGAGWRLLEQERITHVTPHDVQQRFLYARLRREAAPA
jgi:2-polyprenyl-3-methyl-5-hydroxy-6-metoxy-1,4-benzoquinol methylase